MNDNLLFVLEDYFRRIIREEVSAIMPQTSPASSTKVERPVTTKELCAHLGVTEPTIRRWKQKGKIPFFTIGTAVRFHLQDVLKSLEKKK